MIRPLPVAVLVSGAGSTFEGIAETLERERIPARIVLVLSDRTDAPALARARRRGLPTALLVRRGADPGRWAEELTDRIRASGAELVVLAGFLSILPPAWVDAWAGRAINLHPSLLPRYGGRGMHGARVHSAVLAAREAETGATVHLVTNEVDGGPVLGQERIEVRGEDTPESLAERLRPVEIRLLSETIRRFAAGELALPYPVGGPGGVAASASEIGTG